MINTFKYRKFFFGIALGGLLFSLLTTALSKTAIQENLSNIFDKFAHEDNLGKSFETKIAREGKPQVEDSIEAIKDDSDQVEKIADGFEFIEGPVWHPKEFLLFSDIAGDTIYQWQENQKAKAFRRPSGKANGNTLDREGRLITAEHSNRRVSRTEKDGKIVTLANKYEGKLLNSPNDLVVKSDGSIYFTDPPYGIKKEQEELGFYGVYRLAPDGKLTLLVKDFVRPNGLTFSPKEKKLYINDSQESHIRVFDVNSEGTLKNGRIFAELKDPNKKGVPDGMKTDIRGNIYSTGAGGVWVFSATGNLLGIIEVPETTTNLAWGESDGKTLYITAGKSLYRIRLKIAGVRPISVGNN